MTVSKGKITRPINFADPYNCLGVTATNGIYDIATICSSPRINPASKHKPIRGFGAEALTEAQFKGTPGDNAAGIYYGIKLGGMGGRIEFMHDCTYEYQRVRPGTDWSRETDFELYDDNAKFNPIGTLPETVYIDINAGRMDVSVIYDTLNTTGVSLMDVLSSTSNSYTLKDYYPCLLVTTPRGKYARALWSQRYDHELTGEYDGYVPMYDGGAWYGSWEAQMADCPGIEEDVDFTATVFFMHKIVEAGLSDFRRWVDVGSLVNPYNGYACFGAIAKKIKAIHYYTKGLGAVSAYWYRSGSQLRVNITLDWIKPVEGVTYTVSAQVRHKSGDIIDTVGSTAQSFVYRKPVDGLLELAPSLDFALSLLMASNSDTFDIHWEVKTSQNQTVTCNKGDMTAAYSALGGGIPIG